MKIIDLKRAISKLEKEHGNIDQCDINWRYNADSHVHRVNYLEEDLFDAETNNKLDSVVFMSHPFQEGDDYCTVEEGKAVWSCWEDISEQLHWENPDKIYFDSDEKVNNYLKYKNEKTS